MLTAKDASADNRERSRHDRNRDVKLLALKKLQQLLELAGDELFSGAVVLEINSGSGRMGKVKPLCRLK